MTRSKRVIILNKVDSKHIAQAIFILRDENCDEFSAVCEAERIVDEYLSLPATQQKRHFNRTTMFFAVFGIVFLAICFLLK